MAMPHIDPVVQYHEVYFGKPEQFSAHVNQRSSLPTKQHAYLNTVITSSATSTCTTPPHQHQFTMPDNQGCIDWSKSTSIKYLCHFNMRENAVREAVQHKEIDLKHHPGTTRNPADMFTKERKEKQITLHCSPRMSRHLSRGWGGC
jgi:hypothetical protein